MILKRVVVTGIGAITPIGNDTKSFWKGLEEGISGADKITKFDTTHFKTKFACEVKDFDISHILDKKEIRRFDLFSQYAMAASEEAVLDAKILEPTIDRKKLELSGPQELEE